MSGFLGPERTAELWEKVKSVGVPDGGTPGQVLTKTDDGAEWEDVPSGGIVNWEDINGRPDLSSVSSMKVAQIVLSPALWLDDNRQAVKVEGILADEAQQLIIPTPQRSDENDYYDTGITCIEQNADLLVFRADTVPKKYIYVNVFIFEAAEINDIRFIWWSPKMTSDTAPAPFVASASDVYSEQYAAWFAFDGLAQSSRPNDDHGGWYSSAQYKSEKYVQINFGSIKSVLKVRVYPCWETKGILATPTHIYIAGSIDGVDWTDIATYNNIHWGNVSEFVEFDFNKLAQYQYYRFGSRDLKTDETYNNYVAFGDIQFYILEWSV